MSIMFTYVIKLKYLIDYIQKKFNKSRKLNESLFILYICIIFYSITRIFIKLGKFMSLRWS